MIISDLNGYQTIRLPNNNIVNGWFPTIEWFKIIQNYIDFENKSFLDLGCCDFSYGIEAIRSGAKYALGIENSQKRCMVCKETLISHNINNAQIVYSEIEKYVFNQFFDITLFSMIIHWLKDPIKNIQNIINHTNNFIIFIYRVPKTEEDKKFFKPTIEELDNIVNCKRIYHRHLMDGDLVNNSPQYIDLVIYDKNI